jgi:hypothetical protein
VQPLGGGQLVHPALGPFDCSSQCRKRATAAPSRACAARWPACSTGFLTAPWAGRRVACSTNFARRRPQRCEDRRHRALGIDRDALAGKAPFSAARTRRAGAPAPHCRGARQFGVTFSGAMNRSAVPSAWAITKDSATGVRSTSLPRMLSSQATESSAVITTASSPCRQPFGHGGALVGARRPAGIVMDQAGGRGRGRSAHTASTGLRLDRDQLARRLRPAPWRPSAQPLVCSQGS